MAVPLQSPYAQFFDSNGDPLAGGKVYTYIAGTTTPKATYTDADEGTQAANPIILDSAGRAAIWISGTYRIDVYTSADVLVRSTDDVPAFTAGGDMTKAVYDPANIAQQLVGITAVQTLTNKTITTTVSSAGAAGLNVPHGTAPTSPVNGDVWTDTTAARVRINGTTMALNGILTAPQSTTSGTVIDFTSIPAGVKRITINFNGVSTNGTSALLIQLGDSGGVETTGYLGASTQLDASSMAVTNYTNGFGINNPSGGAASVRHGSIVLTLQDATDNTWCCFGYLGYSNAANATLTGGSKTLSAVLDRVRITSVTPDTFDAGEISCLYEF